VKRMFEFFINFRLRFLSALFRSLLTGSGSTYRILFWPRLPHRRTIIYKICRQLGIVIVRKASGRPDCAIYWEDATFSSKTKGPSGIDHSLNGDCRDISKRRVDDDFRSVFGYGLNLDPEKHQGICVAKADENALHDGRIVQCPIRQSERNVVYQVVLDNTTDNGLVMDIRVPVAGNAIPFVYLKYKQLSERFTNEITSVEIGRTEEVFTPAEIGRIIQFCRKMGLDFGELDVLRNRDDGKIYVVDVNKTPWGPPFSISDSNAHYALQSLSRVFEKTFLKKQ